MSFVSPDQSPKSALLSALKARFGELRKVTSSNSLFELDGGARVYVRYSRIHGAYKTFYGLRRKDLMLLEGRPAIICFLWDNQIAPLFIPYAEYEHVFSETRPAPDGQYKAQIYLREQSTELYIARAGRFNVDAYMDWSVARQVFCHKGIVTPTLGHSQVQTLLGSIGNKKGFAVWIPQNNREALDWSITARFECCDALPLPLSAIQNVTQEIDVIWLKRGNSEISAMFEVEHSTPIYSGLLRFNDVHLAAPALVDRFMIVANDERRDRFVRQLSRPTFRCSGLTEKCSFMEYADVFRWHYRLQN